MADSKLDPTTRRRVGMVLAALALIVGWDLPLLLPLRILVVVFHEAGHALTALATGGEVISISVSANEGGLTMTRGGLHLVILNGGYLGSLVAGLALLRLSRKDGRGRAVLGLLGLMLGGAALVWFRPLVSFGFAYAALTAVALVAVAAKARPTVSDWSVRVVGLFSVLYAALDVRDDVLSHGLAAGSVQSDAAALAALTGVPALLWGLGWLVVGGLLLFRLRKQIF